MTEPLHDYIEIDRDRLIRDGWYQQEIDLSEGDFLFTFHYNDLDRCFTVDITDDDGLIYAGEKLILNQRLWRGINDPRLPDEELIPLSNNYDQNIDIDNINRSVFLCFNDL